MSPSLRPRSTAPGTVTFSTDEEHVITVSGVRYFNATYAVSTFVVLAGYLVSNAFCEYMTLFDPASIKTAELLDIVE